MHAWGTNSHITTHNSEGERDTYTHTTHTHKGAGAGAAIVPTRTQTYSAASRLITDMTRNARSVGLLNDPVRCKLVFRRSPKRSIADRGEGERRV